MRYGTVNIIKDRENKKNIQANYQYPEVNKVDGDLYIYASAGDRYDTLANKYYKDQKLWYIIALANIDITSNPASLFPPLGARIRIPADWQTFLVDNEIESARRIFVEITNDYTEIITGFTQIKLY